MELSKLQEDLLRELKEEKELVTDQLQRLDSLSTSLSKPVVTRVLNSVALLVLEALCWIGIAALLVFCVVRDKMYPFYVMARLRVKAVELGVSEQDVQSLYWSVLVFAAIIALLLFVIARNLSRLRRKNKLLQNAAAHIKTMAGEQLKRKAAIAAIDQRHFGILEDEPSATIPAQIKSTDVPNPGF